MGSIYDQIGGTAAVGAAVEDLYGRIAADPQMAPYFDDVDMARLKRHMRAFLTMALGGERLPPSHPARDLRGAHAGLGIGDADFDRMAAHLAGALHGLGVGSGQAHEILARVQVMRGEVTEA